jgi:hypothetical protein
MAVHPSLRIVTSAAGASGAALRVIQEVGSRRGPRLPLASPNALSVP